MKYLLNTVKSCCLIAMLLITTNIKAQDDEFENYAFDDNKADKTPYFALSFGWNANFLFMNYDEINKRLWSPGVVDKLGFSGPVFGSRLDFFTAMSPLVNNARLGVNYFWGSQAKELTASNMVYEPNSGTYFHIYLNFYRKLSINSFGVHFDYAIVPFKSLAILPGIGLKLGTMSLEYYETILPKDWENPDRVALIHNANEKLTYYYASVEPQISIEYAITGFLMLRGAGSYSFDFDRPLVNNIWTINGNNPYSGVPKSVSPKGFSASIGVYLGLFNY